MPVSLRILLSLTTSSRSVAAGAGAAAAAAGGAGAARGRSSRSGGGRRRGGCRQQPERRRRRPRREPVRGGLAAGDGVDVIEDIVASDPSAGTRPGDRRRVEAVLVDEAAHDRRQQTPGGAGGRSRLGSGRSTSGRVPGPLQGPVPARVQPPPAPARALARRGRFGCWRRGFRSRLGSGRWLRFCCGARQAAPQRGSRLGGGASAGSAAGAAAGASPPSLTTAITVPTDDGLPFGNTDLGHRAGNRRRHLRVDLVGRHLEQRLVGVDVVADRLEPLRDRALGDRLAELRERDFSHDCVPRPRRPSLRSPATQAAVGRSSLALGRSQLTCWRSLARIGARV